MGLILAALALVVPPVSVYYGAGASVTTIVAATRARLVLAAITGFGVGFDWNQPIHPDMDFRFTLVPGGGGPGTSLTSTDPPPSLEEAGRVISQGGHPMKGGHPDSPKASRGRSRKRCPSGYRWNGKRCVRKD